MLSTKDHFKTGDTYRLKVKGWKKLFDANGDQKIAGVAILIKRAGLTPQLLAQRRDPGDSIIKSSAACKAENPD